MMKYLETFLQNFALASNSYLKQQQIFLKTNKTNYLILSILQLNRVLFSDNKLQTKNSFIVFTIYVYKNLFRLTNNINNQFL